jgi:hypothetical protein
MKKALAKKSGIKGREIEPRHNEKVDFSKFEPDLSDKDLVALYGIPFPPPFFIAIETLSPAKTVGIGETNLTIIMSTIVQLDAATPYASFDLTQTPSRNPTIQMHFYPAAYGITGTGNYIMEFRIESFGQTNFNLTGYAGTGSVQNGGAKVVSGKKTLTLVLQNVPASQLTYCYLEQTGGSAWNWYSNQVHYPPFVFEP